jgi:hypothetical protein
MDAVLLGKTSRRCPVENKADGRILKCIFEERILRMLAGFNWFSIGFSGGFGVSGMKLHCMLPERTFDSVSNVN